MTVQYITRTHPLYKEAVNIRINCFFNDMKNKSQLIQDTYEESGLHLICLHNNEIVGTGRLNIDDTLGIISQMAVAEKNQRKGIGQLILLTLLKKCEEEQLERVTLNARETAIEFYKKKGFKVSGEKYPSKKTGIIHQKMVLVLKEQ
ncbi:MAG: hypothetical protein COA50_05670 [Flavobacteriaceae bacterium]|nr:MAG: hypothetical protein COA50_05670 [Flavobacteriaceae bacterium]